jgi:hypothetical protein
VSFWIDDLPAMLLDFGVPVVRPNRASFTAIFDRQYAGVGDIPVESYSPALTCITSDVAEVARGEVLTVEGADFTVRSIQPDGAGVSVLILEAA